MFEWNTANVLAAIDAGIKEVIDLYNANYALAVTKLTGINPRAHIYAMSFTIVALQSEERAIARVDAELANA